MDTRQMFNDERYSDIIIKLSDCREYHCHRVVLCELSEQFRTLCGTGTHFATNDRAVLELNRDDAAAAQILLRHLYGHDLREYQGGWRFWMNVHTTATKYGQLPLVKLASIKFSSALIGRVGAEEFVEILKAVEDEYGREGFMWEVVLRVRRYNIDVLLKDLEYRERLGKDTEELWENVDDLVRELAWKNDSICTCVEHQQRLRVILRNAVAGGRQVEAGIPLDRQ